MRKLAAAVLAALATLAACASTRHDSFGEPVARGETVQAAAVIRHPEAYDGRNVVVEGRVDEVCPQKGCWILMRDGDQSLRVTFRNHEFFVPKDCAGRTARIQGEFRVVDLPVELARHFLEDAGQFEEAQKITAPVRTMTLVASGVELLEPDAR
jgi:hypothetical protein